MDIITAHQQGLIEQLEAEVAGLAGRPHDHGQRAVVLHHLYDHSRGYHGWALAEAHRTMRIAERLKKIERRIDSWWWPVRSPQASRNALDFLAEALGEAARARAAAAYRVYRLSATQALRREAEASMTVAMLEALDRCHAARRAGISPSAEERSALASVSNMLASEVVDQDRLDRAWAAVDAARLGRLARALVSECRLDRDAARDARRGMDRAERDLQRHHLLPAAFRANPAQHFYALQRSLSERRRQQWREACDREPDAIALAA